MTTDPQTCPNCQHHHHGLGECDQRVEHDGQRNWHLCLCLNRQYADARCSPLMTCQGGALGYDDVWYLQRGHSLSSADGVITPEVLKTAAVSSAVAQSAPADRAADVASCPGRELDPNPCHCPCYGCKHHCSAHNPDEMSDCESAPAETALRDRIAAALRESCMTEDEAVGPMTDALLAVLPQPVDRAAVYREVADRLAADAERGEKEGFTRIYQRAAATKAREWADDEPLSPYYEHPECGFHWHGRDGMDIPIRDGEPVCPRCEIDQLREKHKASLRRADKVNNELMEEVQRYAIGAERPVLWSVYNRMHSRAAHAEAALNRVGRIGRRLAAHAVGFKDVLDDADHGPWGTTVGADIAELIEALSDQPSAAPAVSSVGQAAHTTRSAVLSAAERTMLTYALDQAQERIWSEDGFTDEDQAAVTSLRRMADETQPAEAAKRPPMDPVHILGIGAPRCDVEFEGGGTCTKAAGHRTPQNQDPHTPPAVGAQQPKEA